MEEIKTGDRVRYRVGKGYSCGRVVNVSEQTVTIETVGGKQVNRLKSEVRLETAEDAEPTTAA